MISDIYLIKLKGAGLSNLQIAQRIGITEHQVALKWEKLKVELEEIQKNGYGSLCDQFTIMANQYQLLGESLKVMGSFVGAVMVSEELRALVDPDLEKTLRNLREKAIVLRPFISIIPGEMIKKTTAGN